MRRTMPIPVRVRRSYFLVTGYGGHQKKGWRWDLLVSGCWVRHPKVYLSELTCKSAIRNWCYRFNTRPDWK